MNHYPLLFLATMIAAVAASGPPGLLNVNAAKVGVEKGKQSGINFSVGIAFTVALQVYLSVRIAKFLARNPEVIAVLMKAALVLFAVLALFFFVKGYRRTKKVIALQKSDSKNSFIKGFFLAWLNFLQIPFYSWLNTVLHKQQIMNFEIIDEIIFIVAAAFGTFLVMYFYVFYFNKLESKTNWFSKNSNYVLGALMLLLLCITLIRVYYR